jgi:hypothetical protein
MNFALPGSCEKTEMAKRKNIRVRLPTRLVI